MRRNVLTFLLLLICVLAGVGVVRSAAPPTPLQGALLPIVAVDAPTPTPTPTPTSQADLATVLERSCGYANAIVQPDGTIYVMVQDYARGGRLYVYIDDGGPTLHAALAPPLAGPPADTNAPAFNFPAQKNGPGSMVIAGGLLIIYAP